MSPLSPEPGTTLTATFPVLPSDLASVISPDANDTYPAVFATSRLVAFMEIVAARMLVPYLSPGQLSVGVKVDVIHSAPTPVGSEVRFTAKYLGMEGKTFAFEIVAEDPKGEVGRAKHTRAVVEQKRLMVGAAKRAGKVVGKMGKL